MLVQEKFLKFQAQYIFPQDNRRTGAFASFFGFLSGTLILALRLWKIHDIHICISDFQQIFVQYVLLNLA